MKINPNVLLFIIWICVQFIMCMFVSVSLENIAELVVFRV